MFSVREKRMIAEAVQQILRSTGHSELPSGEIQFRLHVQGAEEWSWADIQNNGAVTSPTSKRWNEEQDAGAVIQLESLKRGDDDATKTIEDLVRQNLDLTARVAELERINRDLHPDNAPKDCWPVVLYLPSERAKDELIEEMQIAYPEMRAVPAAYRPK